MRSGYDKAYSLRYRTNERSSCSSLSSFADDTPKKRKKTDRMIYSIEKSQFEWSQKTIRRVPLKHQQNNNQASNTNFEDYLSDKLSDENQSFNDFFGKTIRVKKQQSEKIRKLYSVPFKQTKIKHWKDNFYTNLLEWNHDNLIFAATDSQIWQYKLSSLQYKGPRVHSRLYEKGSKICSIKGSPTDQKIVVAYESGTLRVYDYERQKNLHVNILHTGRISALDWNENIILTGSRDRTIRMIDSRTYKHPLQFAQIHKDQILGIKRCGDLIATGGNDNLVTIYDIRKQDKIVAKYYHQAAVKALAWVESEKKLLSGGGTSDKKIVMWDYKKDLIEKEIETGSQVCNILVSKNTKEFVSCQGFSQNQVVLWDLECKRLQSLHGKHTRRVLYCALSPSGEYLATGAGDQNLLVWKMFPNLQRKNRLMDVSDLR